MEGILVLIFVVLVVAGVVVFVRGRNAETVGGGDRGPAGLGAGPPGASGSPAAAAGGSGVRTLKPGDVVNYDGSDFIVEGTLRLEQGGFRWDEHRLVDGPRSLWLSVEDDEGLEVVVWDRGKGIELEPGANTLTHDGVTYELEERGTANYTAEGSTGTGGGGKVEYADYSAPGDKALSFERFGAEGSWEVGVGTVISEHLLDIYPGRGL